MKVTVQDKRFMWSWVGIIFVLLVMVLPEEGIAGIEVEGKATSPYILLAIVGYLAFQGTFTREMIFDPAKKKAFLNHKILFSITMSEKKWSFRDVRYLSITHESKWLHGYRGKKYCLYLVLKNQTEKVSVMESYRRNPVTDKAEEIRKATGLRLGS